MKTNENSLFRPIERNNNGSVTDECWNDICNIIKDEGIVILPFEHRHGYDVVFSKWDLKLWRYKIDNNLLYTLYCRKSEMDKAFNAPYNGNNLKCKNMEDFVTFELAKKLKEKGFVLNYNLYGYRPIYSNINTVKLVWNIGAYEKEYFGENIPCPTISQVLKWLRDEKKLYVEPCILADADTDADGKVINEYIYWSFSITDIETGDMIYFEYEQHIDDKRFDSYEEAALAGIEYILDDLI